MEAEDWIHENCENQSQKNLNLDWIDCVDGMDWVGWVVGWVNEMGWVVGVVVDWDQDWDHDLIVVSPGLAHTILLSGYYIY